ncbi:GtrA family protein [Quadrisphaera sp. DSM 44207]|uniref:GtrA family protein n=1 Tax=Quadrisphaera sp. DSM 44207 TaxID=1881057 RepID=UPI00088BA3BE|nr:GtrA family protein [Quadrisphaera sp. DSM 44207]SDQ09680.1 Putative flippase GtrA (transmembrane translocase of bactoprenol-linked glucose) [Quadrisphaera sp. DSM 44207]
MTAVPAQLGGLLRQHRELVLYGLIGGTSALLDLVVFLVLVGTTSISEVLATCLSVSVGIVTSFTLNARFNYRTSSHLVQRFAAFYAVGFLGVVMSAAILFLLHDKAGMAPWGAKVISIPAVVVTQFLVNRKVAFGDVLRHTGRFSGAEVAVLAVAGAGMLANSLIGLTFADEHDNFMGGVLLTRGELPYQDYHSHHMPLAYYAAGVIAFFTGSDFVLFRAGLAVVLFGWLLAVHGNLKKAFGRWPSLLAVLLLAGLQPVFWTQHMTADTLTAFAVAHFLAWLAALLWQREDPLPPLGWGQLLLRASLTMVPVLGTLPTAPLSAAMIAVLVVVVWGGTSGGRLRRAVTALVRTGLACLPIAVLTMAPTALTGGLGAFYASAFTFNTEYYADHVADLQPTLRGTLVAAALQPLRGLLTFEYGFAQQDRLGSFVDLATVLVVVLLVLAAWRARAAGTRWFALALALVTYAAASRSGFRAFTYYHEAAVGTAFVIALVALLWLCAHPAAVDVQRGLVQALAVVGVLVTVVVAAFGVRVGFPSWTSIANAPREHVRAQLGAEDERVELFREVTDEVGGTFWDGPYGFYSAAQLPERRASYYTFFLPWQADCGPCSAKLERDLQRADPVVVHWTGEFLSATDYAPAVSEVLAQGYYQVGDPRLADIYFSTDHRARIDALLQRNGYDV